MKTIEKFVELHIVQNVTRLISDLSNAGLYHKSASSICELHPEIFCKDNYQDAAEDAGWEEHLSLLGDNFYYKSPDPDDNQYCDTWQELCESQGIDPYQEEALEHWIVSDWLADRLLAKDEMVSKDVHGLIIWGRTTSGQAVKMDDVIQGIYEKFLEGRG